MASDRPIERVSEQGAWPHVAVDAEHHPATTLDSNSVHLWLLRAVRGDPAARVLLARYAGVAADALAVEIGAHGKPALRGMDLAFNLSHSGPHTLLAVARGCALGVDLEHRRRVRRRSALLERCFGPAERERIAACDDPDASLLRHWAAKEAVVKAIGRGIAYGLRRIEVDASSDALALLALEGDAGPAPRWRVHGLTPAAEAFAAVAYDGPPRRVHAFAA